MQPRGSHLQDASNKHVTKNTSKSHVDSKPENFFSDSDNVFGLDYRGDKEAAGLNTNTSISSLNIFFDNLPLTITIAIGCGLLLVNLLIFGAVCLRKALVISRRTRSNRKLREYKIEPPSQNDKSSTELCSIRHSCKNNCPCNPYNEAIDQGKANRSDSAYLTTSNTLVYMENSKPAQCSLHNFQHQSRFLHSDMNRKADVKATGSLDRPQSDCPRNTPSLSNKPDECHFITLQNRRCDAKACDNDARKCNSLLPRSVDQGYNPLQWNRFVFNKRQQDNMSNSHRKPHDTKDHTNNLVNISGDPPMQSLQPFLACSQGTNNDSTRTLKSSQFATSSSHNVPNLKVCTSNCGNYNSSNSVDHSDSKDLSNTFKDNKDNPLGFVTTLRQTKETSVT